MKRNKDSLRELWDNIKGNNWIDYSWKLALTWKRKQSPNWRKQNPIQDKQKEGHYANKMLTHANQANEN